MALQVGETPARAAEAAEPAAALLREEAAGPLGARWLGLQVERLPARIEPVGDGVVEAGRWVVLQEPRPTGTRPYRWVRTTSARRSAIWWAWSSAAASTMTRTIGSVP